MRASDHDAAAGRRDRALYVLPGQVVDWISVSGGTGFDGAVHIDHLQRRAAGEPVRGDPYWLMRLPGFLPALLS